MKMPSSSSNHLTNQIIQDNNSNIIETIRNELSLTENLTRLFTKLTPVILTNKILLDKLSAFIDTNSDTVNQFKNDFNNFLSQNLDDSDTSNDETDNQPIHNANNNNQTNESAPVNLQIEIKTEPGCNSHSFYNRATYFARRKEYKKALHYYERSLEKDPHYAEAYSGKGEAYYYLNNNDEALVCFEKSIELDAFNPSAYNGKGLVLADLSKNTEAILFYNKAIELNPTNGEFYANKAECLDKLGRGSDVIEALLKAIECEPNDADTYLLLGLAYKNYKKDFKNAFECFDKACELKSDNAYCFYNKGDALDNLGKGEEAIECYKLAISLEQNDQDFYCSLGAALKRFNSDYTNALECFQKAIDIKPDPNYYYYKGDTYSLLEDYKSAIKCFNKAINLDPTNSDYYYSKGNAYYEIYSSDCSEENLDKSIECFEKSLELNANDYDCLYDLGNAYYARKKLGKAGSCFKKAIQINPNKADAYNGRGLVLNDKKGYKNEYKEAINCYAKAIELDPTNPLFHRNKGITYFNMKEYEAALDCYDEAIRLDSKDAEFYYYKGEALKVLQRYAQAKAYFKKAINIKPDYVNAKKNLCIVNQKLNSLIKDDEKTKPIKVNNNMKSLITDDDDENVQEDVADDESFKLNPKKKSRLSNGGAFSFNKSKDRN